MIFNMLVPSAKIVTETLSRSAKVVQLRNWIEMFRSNTLKLYNNFQITGRFGV